MKPVKLENKPVAAKTVAPQLSATELKEVSAINASCRWPVGAWFLAGLFWLGIGVLLSAFAYLKLLMPDLFGDAVWMSYGRIKPVGEHLLMYGFALPVALGTAYWMLVRLGRKPSSEGVWIITGTVLWNGGIALGTGLIMAGDGTGYAWMEYPGNASLLLILGFALIALSCWRIYFKSENRHEYPAQGFLLGGILWFGLAFAISWQGLLCQPLRGVTQMILASWFGACLFHLGLLPMGLGVLFYLVPQLAGKPLHSAGTTRFAFWVLALFGGGCGFLNALPVPRWLPAVTAVCQTAMLLVVLAVFYNLVRTLKGDYAVIRRSMVQRLLWLGLISWGGIEILSLSLVRLAGGQNLQFTWIFTLPKIGLLIGFAIPVFAGAMLNLLPQLLERPWKCARKLHVHYWGTMAGWIIIFLGLLVAGLKQGSVLTRADRPFNDTWMLMHIPLTVVVAGWVILAAAQFALIAGVVEVLWRWSFFRERPKETCAPVGVKEGTT